MIVKLNSGHFSEQPPFEKDGTLEKQAMLVYTGKFESMDGEVEIKDEHLELLAKNHNGLFAKMKRLATGELPAKAYPPIQLDHSVSAKDTVGRLVGDLSVGEYEENGEKKKALFGNLRILGKENVEKVKDGRWTHLSIGADLDKGVLNELTITPFPAAPNAAMLSKKKLSEGGDENEMPPKSVSPEKQGLMDKLAAMNYIEIAREIRKGELKYEDVEEALELHDMTKLYAVEEVLLRWERRGLKIKASSAVPVSETSVEMPGHVDEAKWNKAKEIVQKEYGEIRWPVVQHVYQNMSSKRMSSHEKKVGSYNGWTIWVWVEEEDKKTYYSGTAFRDSDDKSINDPRAYDSEAKAVAAIKSEIDKRGSKMSKKHAEMSEDEKKSSHEKMKKHLMDKEKMSEKDAEDKLSKMKDDEKDEMAAKCSDGDGGDKDDKEKEAKMRAKLQVEKDLKERKSNAVSLMKGIRENLSSASLEEKKVRLMGRISKLRLEAKISPAEVKSINIEELAALDEKGLSAVMSSYEKREPVIMTGVYGTMKAEDLTKLAERMKSKELEDETIANMPSLRMAKKNMADAGVAVGGGGGGGYKIDSESISPGPVAGGGTDKFSAGQNFEMALSEYHKAYSEGRGEEGLKALRDKLSKLWQDDHTKEVVGPLSHGMEEQEKRMSALAESVRKVQNQSEDLIKLVSEELELVDSDLT